MAEKEMDEARRKRRTAKAALTRGGNTLRKKLKECRPVDEIMEAFHSMKAAFENLVVKHEEYTQLIQEDEAFEAEEKWLEECEDFYLQMEICAKDYSKSVSHNGKSGLDSGKSASDNGTMVVEGQETVLASEASDLESGAKDLGSVIEVETTKQTEDSGVQDKGIGANGTAANGTETESGNGHPKVGGNPGESEVGLNNGTNHENSENSSCGFKMEKPKMPRFAGDVRDYTIFRSDFRHAVDTRYTKRDAISLLRTSLQGRPLELIKGIGTDYDAAWSYLDSVYGDPRFVADTITQDITRFRPLRDGEDARFCDLVHLVQRSFSTLKEVGRPHDMDNNHMLALIEQRMCTDDRKVWARHLENSGKEATLAQLIAWMNIEMKSRMRATAPLRCTGQPTRHPVGHIGSDFNSSKSGLPNKCWICKNSNHWTDQCHKFVSLSLENRIKAVKENHACFSCLKRAGRDHRSYNCSRRRQCPEKSNGNQCPYYHHPLLHGAIQSTVATVTSVNHNQKALLPIVQVDIVGSGRLLQRANALLDSGAQISLIRSSVAEDLKLKGRDIVVTITKVGGQEEELSTKNYQVRIRSLEDRSAHVIQAIGIPTISEDITDVKVADVARQLGLGKGQLRRGNGHTDLLIGIDQAKLHTGKTRQVAFIGDISKMYHRIRIPEMDQHVHRFLWRNLQTHREPDVYVKTVLTFGDKPAPAMAQIALRKTAEEAKKAYPTAAQVIQDNTYMDDICDSVPTMEEARDLTKDIDSVLETGGFRVKGWVSNKVEKSEASKEEQKAATFLQGGSVEKVLGVVWDSSTDTFSFKVASDLLHCQVPIELSKRKVLSQIARIYDPIGFASAFMIRAKIALQALWKRGISWDEELPPELSERWKRLFQEMVQLNGVRFDRCLTPPNAIGQPVLCVFSDASEDAFGACAYARWQLSTGGFNAQLIAAKSRVAPLKKLTIPRLELQAAVLASRLGKTILKESRLKFEKSVFFLDSKIVLAWICSETRRFKPFVSVRVGEIQDNSDPAQWRHVPGDQNVADEVSRGIPVESLTGRWQYGPDFLRLPESEWPQDSPVADEVEVEKEHRKVHIVGEQIKTQPLIDCKKFSNWRRLIRVTAYMLRFIWRLRTRGRKGSAKEEEALKHEDGPLSPKELQDAETHWLKESQKTLKDSLRKGEFRNLSPYVDPEGVVRVGGRADKALVSYETRHPILLPRDHWISRLIVQHAHQFGHPGVAATVAKTRTKYWIVRAHDLAKSVKFRCVVCREIGARVESQVMADLPQSRLAPFTPPFHHTSCDYFGPYRVRISRNKTVKHYAVIFTCLNTRAVHLELAADCTTMEFMQVLRRFYALRGVPALMISDNGSQLVGAERELREMIELLDREKLQEFSAERGMKWQFTTPAAPHQNGCAESLVKSCKIGLKKAIGEQILTPLELQTCLLEVANLVNQRPIGRIPSDPDDGSYLCPNDVLLGRASSTVPQGPFRHTKNPRHRVEFVQKIVDSFWTRWTRDVFPSLLPRKQWHTEKRNVQVDDFVIVQTSSAIRGTWNVGRVVSVYPGQDGKVRNVKVKTRTGEYERPITKIAVIYPAEGYEEHDK